MKRSPRTVFDDRGVKWYQSPVYKEVKMDQMENEMNYSLREEFEDSSRLIRDRFYDFFNRVTKMGESRIDLEELSKSLTVKVDEIPDSTKVSEIFERLNSKVAMNSKGKKNWSEEETNFFIWMIINYSELNKTDFQDLGDNDWDYIASMFPAKKADQCKIKWQSLLKVNLSRAPWNAKEDEILRQIITERGPKKWKEIAIELNERTGNTKFFRQGKQCRERWINHLDPSINRGSWTQQEDVALLEAHLELGKKWADIAKRLKNRTENSVKNRFNSLMKKYRNEGFESETNSMVSGISGGSNSIEELERKLSEMIIHEKKKEMSNLPTPSHIPEVSEEEYLSDNDPTLDTNKFEEETFKKQYQPQQPTKKKSAGLFDVTKSKNTLKDLITQEIGVKQQTTTSQSTQPSQQISGNPLFPQGISQIQSGSLMSNPLYSSNQGLSLFGKSGPVKFGNNAEASPGLFGRAGNFGSNSGVNLFGGNSGSDMLNFNLWMMNPNNSNIFGQSNLADQSPVIQQQQQQQQHIQYPHQMQQLGGQVQTLSAYPEIENQKNITQQQQQQQTEEKVYKLVEKPLDDFNPHEFQGLHYAIVDNNSGNIYFLTPVTKDNFPPNIVPATPNTQARNRPIPNTGMEFVMSSPALGNVNFSPNLFANNNLMSLVKNQLSPGVNFFHESPGTFLTSEKSRNLGNWSSEWTPETSSRPFNQQDSNSIKPANILWGGNQMKLNSPDQRFGINNSAFLKQSQSMMGMPILTPEGIKLESPNNYMEGLKGRNINK